MGRMILVLCGLVVALAIGGSAPYGPAPGQEADSREAARDQGAEAATAERQGEGRQRTDQAEDSGADLARADLTAQQIMAAAALFQAILTGVGIWYVRKTLIATNAAVREANAATGAAIQAAELGDAQLQAMRSSEQAYIYFTPDTPHFTRLADGTMLPRINVSNLGRTPARSLIVFRERHLTPKFKNPRRTGGVLMVPPIIAAGASEPLPSRGVPPDDNLDHISLLADYIDAFGAPRRSYATFKIDRERWVLIADRYGVPKDT